MHLTAKRKIAWNEMVTSTIPQLDLPIAIIAGGKSTRFGSQKLDYQRQGKSLIEHSVEIASQISKDIYIIRGKKSITLNEKWNVIEDLVSDCGPIGGIYTALKMINCKWLAVMPADMPYLLPAVYKILSDARKKDRPVVAVSRSGLEPLVSIWPASVLGFIENQVMARKFKLYQALKELKATEVDLHKIDKKIDSNVFYNINSPSDLDRVE